MIKKINIDEFIDTKDNYVILDTRTPAEYEKAHIPQSFNLALLNNEDRAKVGTTYKQKGREEAILLGFDLTAIKWRGFIEQALQFAPNKKVAVYCWRGGMRSDTMAWILDLYGFDVVKLVGGYKAYRNWVLMQFEKDYPVIVLGGMTGSHKTEVLYEFAKRGEQIIDLENLAQHLGSSYGSMNKLKQPSQEHFENLLADELYKIKPKQRVWFEDESRTIGKRVVPSHIYDLIRQNLLINLDINKEQRISFLVEEYCVLDKDFLIEATERISKRLGPEQTKMAVKAIQKDNMSQFIDLVLNYYDKAYHSGMNRRNVGQIISIHVDYQNAAQCADEILNFINNNPNDE